MILLLLLCHLPLGRVDKGLRIGVGQSKVYLWLFTHYFASNIIDPFLGTNFEWNVIHMRVHCSVCCLLFCNVQYFSFQQLLSLDVSSIWCLTIAHNNKEIPLVLESKEITNEQKQTKGKMWCDSRWRFKEEYWYSNALKDINFLLYQHKWFITSLAFISFELTESAML